MNESFESMMAALMVFLGGGFGALLRYGVSTLWFKIGHNTYYATLFINISGSFIIGLCAGYLLYTHTTHQLVIRHLFMVGLLGGFTTFSSFSLEIVTLLQRGLLESALLYIVMSLSLALLATYLGIVIIKMIVQ